MLNLDDFYQLLVEHSTDAIFFADKACIIRYVNPIVEDVLGFEPAELIGKNVSVLIPPMPEAMAGGMDHDEIVQRYLMTGNSGIMGVGRDVMAVHKDRGVVPIELRLSEVELQGSRYFIASLRNITKRAEAQKALEYERKCYKDVLELTSDWLWETDSELRFTHVSEKIFEMAGGQDSAVRAEGPIAFLEAAMGEKLRAVLRDGEAASDAFQRCVIEITLPDGRGCFVQVNSRPVIDSKGATIGYRGSAQDITAKVTAEKETIIAHRQALAASQAKSAFLANMSHELRTPLNAIIGFAELMEREFYGSLGDPRYQEYAGHISQSGLHLLDLVSDILDMSKIEVGRMELHKEKIDLREIIEAAQNMIAVRLERRHLSLRVEVAEDISYYLEADPRALKQVVINLLTNAVKFTEPGGRITLRAYCEHHETGADAVIVVSDTGIGMNPADLKVAMTPFGQVDSALNRPHEGTGLGLPLSQSLVDLHGGGMTIESERGHGTTVTVRLPAIVIPHVVSSAS